MPSSNSRSLSFYGFRLLFGIGIFLIAIGAVRFAYVFHFQLTGVPSIAIITHIDQRTDSEDEPIIEAVHITYSFNGKTYYGNLPYYTSFQKVGSEIRLYPHPDNPAKFQGTHSFLFPLVTIWCGIVMAMLGRLSLRSINWKQQ